MMNNKLEWLIYRGAENRECHYLVNPDSNICAIVKPPADDVDCWAGYVVKDEEGSYYKKLFLVEEAAKKWCESTLGGMQ